MRRQALGARVVLGGTTSPLSTDVKPAALAPSTSADVNMSGAPAASASAEAPPPQSVLHALSGAVLANAGGRCAARHAALRLVNVEKRGLSVHIIITEARNASSRRLFSELHKGNVPAFTELRAKGSGAHGCRWLVEALGHTWRRTVPEASIGPGAGLLASRAAPK